jgi:hypothetical protein
VVHILIHLDWSAKKAYQRYRRHFGIESSFRQLRQVGVPPTSCNPALLFFLLGLALLLVNIWVRLRCSLHVSLTVARLALTLTYFVSTGSLFFCGAPLKMLLACLTASLSFLTFNAKS